MFPTNKYAQPQIMTASGSNKENPAASYFKILRTPEEILKTRRICSWLFDSTGIKCHDHQFERWNQDQYYQTAAFFLRVGLKKDEVSGDKTIGGTAVEGAKPLYEVIMDTNTGEMKHQRTGSRSAVSLRLTPLACREHGVKNVRGLDDKPRNPYFAKSYVNRLWGYMWVPGSSSHWMTFERATHLLTQSYFAIWRMSSVHIALT